MLIRNRAIISRQKTGLNKKNLHKDYRFFFLRRKINRMHKILPYIILYTWKKM